MLVDLLLVIQTQAKPADAELLLRFNSVFFFVSLESLNCSSGLALKG